MVITGYKILNICFALWVMVREMKCEKFTGEIIEMTWHDLYWKVVIIENGISVAEENIKIITIKKKQEIITTSNELLVEFETVRLSAPKGMKYAVSICDYEMEIEMINSD